MVNPVESISTTKDLKPKMKFTGKVLKTTLAGAVVDIGIGKPAMLHVSQMIAPSDQPIKSVKDVLQEGQEIDVWIRRIREDRIELTMLEPLGLEWREIKKDMVVKGKVVRIEPFGVFLEIGAERPGLIHISELTHGYVHTPAEVVKEGDELEAKVIDFNKSKKQIKLSLKALEPEPVKEEATHPEGDHSKERRRRKDTRRRKDENGQSPAGKNTGVMGNNTEKEAGPTAMEIAIREAMDKAKANKVEDRSKKVKTTAQKSQQEEILARTLENKVDSSR
jgi:ribosomal protein S1